MKNRLTEPTIIFLNIVIWVFLATCIGLIVGFSTAIFLKLLKWGTSFTEQYTYYYLSLPLALLGSVILVHYLAPDARGHGTEKVIEAVHKNSGKIKPNVVPVKLLATILTISAGGSAGKEGPCAQIGAGLASIFADLFRFNDNDRKRLVICGVSAGFASVFGTPIAGAIFGVEVLFMGSILYDVLLPSVIAGITAHHVSASLGITYFYHTISFVPVFSESFFLKVVAAGVFFGLCSLILVEMLKGGEYLSAKIKISQELKGVIGGVVLIILTLLFSRQYLGLGLNVIESILTGTSIIWFAFLLKSLFTTITLSTGGSGGIVTPIFFIGAAAGAFFAKSLGLDTSTFAAIGMVSLLAGAANTPIAASIMAVELFGPKVAPYAAVSCVISFLMTGHRSVYPSQILSVTKDSSIQVEVGQEMQDVVPLFRPESGSLIEKGLNMVQFVIKKIHGLMGKRF
jgi:chloride channel protein, CIC family